MQLGVGTLPAEEVAQSILARRADDEVWVRDTMSVQVPLNHGFIDGVGIDPRLDDLTNGPEELLAATIVEREGEDQVVVVPSAIDRTLDCSLQVR